MRGWGLGSSAGVGGANASHQPHACCGEIKVPLGPQGLCWWGQLTAKRDLPSGELGKPRAGGLGLFAPSGDWGRPQFPHSGCLPALPHDPPPAGTFHAALAGLSATVTGPPWSAPASSSVLEPRDQGPHLGGWPSSRLLVLSPFPYIPPDRTSEIRGRPARSRA